MKKNRILRYILIGLLSMIIVGILGLVVWSKTGTYPAGTVAQAALASSDSVRVSQEKFIVFTPVEGDINTGLIFYPGGLVEPTAYAPILRMIAEEGVLVVITPMPLNLGILNTGAAGAVIEAYPNISTWILAGHSLGGASAAIYAEKNLSKIDAIVFWDSYPPDSADLSTSTIPVLSIFGTTNDIPNTDNFNDKRYLLPTDAIFVAVEGASHAQFGDYGPQKGDVVASLGLTEQHELVAAIMLDFIFQKK